MPTDVIVALIVAGGAVAGAVAGALVNKYGDDIKHWLTGRNKNSTLIGQWSCEWKITEPKREVDTINDTVQITKATDNLVEGIGTGADIENYTLAVLRFSANGTAERA